ncbi:hypothetical protein [Devosia aquimaris]|uniref:hypothetical protein n=1 Tax=Devosia aquimaris TaxID=2866214 RepID=UPI001CD078AF|nr:hypothetical protein [Devosia sp. CJK-A8-3]
MILITNISLTERAAPHFRRKRLAFRADPGEVFALVWVSNHADADGTPVPGFEPGYMCGPVYSQGLASPWALAQLPDGSQFYFMPRFTWSAQEHYLVDRQGTLFSIAAATG